MHTRTPCRTTISIVALMASHTAEVISQRALQFLSANRAPTLFYSHLTISQLSTDLPTYNARFRPPSYNRDQ